MGNVTWECDDPHSDTTWPRSPEIAGRQLEGLTDQEINKVTHENAMTHFSYNPLPISSAANAPSARCGRRTLP